MKIAVWDTYVKTDSGNVLHFDILAPETIKDSSTIFNFGKQYLAAVGEDSNQLSAEECQFCHIEEPTAEMMADIKDKGYHIVEMDTIPESLSENASRREKILFLRGHNPKLRFASFAGTPDHEIDKMITDNVHF